jgi:membrane-associated protein
VLFIIFAESGLFFGFFLPGDSLLFTAGFLASQGYFNIAVLVIGCAIAAIAGDSAGYAFGHKVGPKIFTREDSFFFHKRHIERSRAFFEAHGKKTIILARFIPVVRTFAPILAGVGGMRYRTFLSYNVFGGLVWGAGFPVLGYMLGHIIPSADKYILPIVLGIVLVSFIPVAWEFWKDKRAATAKNR